MSTTPATPKAPSAQHTPTARHIELAETICPLSSTSSMQAWRTQWVKDSAQLIAESDATQRAERDRLRDALVHAEYFLDLLAGWGLEGDSAELNFDNMKSVASDGLQKIRAIITGTTPSESARLRECNAELASVLGEYVNVGAVPMWLQKKGLAALDKHRA